MCMRTLQPTMHMFGFLIAIMWAIKSAAAEFLYFLLYLSVLFFNSSEKTLAA
jgi:hypothetical protein